jgi:hypothetical protein
VRWRTSFTAVAFLVGVAVAGCGPQSSASQEAAPPPGTHVDQRLPAPAAATPTAGATPIGTPLYTRLSNASAVGDTGQALTATLAGTTYRGATGVWVGCEGTATTSAYRLGGEFTKLSGVLGLQPHTPPRLQVRFTVLVDGESKFSATLRRDDQPQALAIALTGARSLTVTALAMASECAPAAAPYGAIGAASLT